MLINFSKSQPKWSRRGITRKHAITFVLCKGEKYLSLFTFRIVRYKVAIIRACKLKVKLSFASFLLFT